MATGGLDRYFARMTWLLDHLGMLYVALEWAIRLFVMALVPFRRSPEAARSWLLLVFFLPVPGFLLYLLIGRPNFPGWRRRRFLEAQRLLDPVPSEEGLARADPDHGLSIEREQIRRLAFNVGGHDAIGGNRAEIITDYETLVARLVADIDAARHQIHLQTYIFADDAVGRRIIKALARAEARGVVCRVMIDAFGSRRWVRGVTTALEGAGVETRVALALRLFRRTRADLRNHRKLAIIDGALGYVGSQNIVAADFRAGVVNEELVARLEGPIATDLERVFVQDWYLEAAEDISNRLHAPENRQAGRAVLQLLPSGPDYRVAGTERMVVALVYAARKRLVLTTPYLIPDEGLLEGLQTAVLRGVDVRIVVSLVQDQRLAGLAQRSFYAQLLDYGVRIFLYKDRLLHAKHLTVDDDLALIGSSNLDIRSFTLNSEASILAYDPAVVERLHGVQEGYFAGSLELDAATWASRPLIRKLGENVARLVSPLL